VLLTVLTVVNGRATALDWQDWCSHGYRWCAVQILRVFRPLELWSALVDKLEGLVHHVSVPCFPYVTRVADGLWVIKLIVNHDIAMVLELASILY
jgi:hypothetical protein